MDENTNNDQNTFYEVHLRKTVEERTITEFPRPYNYDCSPHGEMNFSYRIHSACHKINISKCEMFCLQAFDTNYKATIGVDFEAEKFYILGVPYILQLWDTAGQEKFKCIASSHYKGARVVILVFDFCVLSSLYNIPKWLDETLKCTSKPLLFLVGTKKDAVANSAYKLTENEAIKVANTINAEYWPVSSKTGENIDALFQRIASVTFCEDILKETADVDLAKINENFVSKDQQSKSEEKERKMCVRLRLLTCRERRVTSWIAFILLRELRVSLKKNSIILLNKYGLHYFLCIINVFFLLVVR
ncbi:ras-related protein Rab-34 isoform X2 [Parasteatoda tepidariorum]|uniref:ras-related protein Rab-34 isoform X2 n=1 Tax=Parasteatoda tepidariorum TaxID=114398 RepID=UPI001C720429|nr:ras-related protein Rab-34-like isoform X2 [Parasteatoda tepidariorum]